MSTWNATIVISEKAAFVRISGIEADSVDGKLDDKSLFVTDDDTDDETLKDNVSRCSESDTNDRSYRVNVGLYGKYKLYNQDLYAPTSLQNIFSLAVFGENPRYCYSLGVVVVVVVQKL